MEFYAGCPLVLYVWIYAIHSATSYDQLVNTTKTKVESSSMYKYGAYSGSADKTIDKNFDQAYTNCMHTAPGRKRAWLRIDLGDYFNLKSVKIWYRSDKNRRLKGFSIFASYMPEVDKKYTCYQDPGNKILNTVLEVDCTRLARYVTIFNDQANDQDGVILEICEVEIYGCPRHKYGEKCARCGMCKYECDITGRCDTHGCKDGYHPPFCKVCSPGRYGEDCKGVCGHCERNEACPNINESCPGLCKPRYYMEKCPTRQLVNPTFTLANSSSVGYRGYPNKTVDGNFSQSHYLHCMHTSGIGTEAWLRINLRKIYNISSVKFWYRNDRKYPESPNTRRIQGYNIRLSNTTQIKHQDVCFQHTGNETLPPIIENKCEGVAQYVWIYTNKSFHDGVFLEICEVQIFGCSYQENGGKCVPCDQCKNDCKENGECDEHGCKMDGYLPPYCKKCKRRRFGKDCNSTCGHCANNIPCDDVTGSCPDGNCSPGWKHTKDRKCDQKCDNGYFGMECRSNCSGHCAGGIPCNKINGYCLGGCADGWINSYCNGTCKENFYGRNCSILCGHCANSAKCDHVTGSCPSGHCEPGYKYNEKKCDEECDDGTFGYHCRETCSGHCAGKVPCNKANGYCPGRCADGWINLFCNESCKNGFYGKNCSLPCGHCLNNTKCDHVTGSCPSGHCELGWKNTYGRKCDEECDNGTFGYHCRETCSGHCAGKVPCNKANGYCPGRCADGWINLFCNESCKSKSYGKNCSFACGHCEYNANCDHVTGSCPSGRCEPGYKHNDKKCNEECDDGTFGYHCRENCSGNCAGKVPCNKTDGTCPGGCADGWQNPDCNEKCDMGFYGKDCKEKCGHCRGVVTCHHINGSCHGLCESGYQGDKCYTECDNGTFGLRCNFTCGEGCSAVCNKKNGTCDQCQYGYIGDYCNITVAEAQDPVPIFTAVGVGGAFMTIVVIAVIVLVFVLARKARQKKAGDIELPEKKEILNKDLQENNTEGNANITENGGLVEENADIEYIVTDNGQKKTLIKIADLGKIIKVFSLEENKKFTEEFKEIPYGEQHHIPCSTAKLQQNMPKNRYKTTFPYDHSRVVLNVCPDNDYINANYIKDVEGKRRYIATQGPRKNTIQDFWAMIWQENIRVIVMVTKLTEGSTIKCEQYWPGHGDQMTSGQFCLQLMSQKDYANYTQRDINITNKKTKVVKTVNQVQFTAWPDHGTPSPIELLVFYRHVMRLMQIYTDSLLVVHCSAGIGRTGTFIALDALYKHGLKEGNIDVVEYVKIMREDRMNMIQNAGQYVFLYKALYEIFKTNGRLLKKEQFIQEVTSQLMSDKAANASQFKKEFNELLSIRPVLDEKDTKDARQNIDLNMTKTVLPADGIRVLLTSYVRGRGNYYNAVPISSYTLRDGLIAAQYPVEGAAVDLVRLLTDQECTILVSINQLSDIATSAEWLTTSAEKSIITPYKTMLTTGRSLSNKLKMSFIKMKHDQDSEWHTVKVLEILNWKINEKLPAEEDVFVELINKVQEIIKDPETKITVLSRDGATGCGIFCAVYIAIQQLQQDNEVDMFTIVRQLQMRRPEMVSSMAEYQCCCRVVANFFTAHKDDIYENAQGQQGVSKTDENIYANTNS